MQPEESVIDAIPEEEAAKILDAANLPHIQRSLVSRVPDYGLPSVPVSAADLAALTGDRGVEIIQARDRILKTARAASILATHPEDWILHKNREGVVVGYLADSGCQRIAPIWGISVFDLSKPEKQQLEKGFIYIVSGSGHCKLTGQTIEGEEGGRSSEDDVAKYSKGAEQELLVRKCARANLDGRIIRKLTGMGAVPMEELKLVAPSHRWDNARKGRGFGTSQDRSDERTGVSEQDVDMSIPVPKCPKCNGPMWDNRKDKKRSANAPIFKCKDRQCGAGVWADKAKPATTAPATGEPAGDETQPATITDQHKATAATGEASEAVEKEKKLKLISAQFRSLKWDDTKKAEYLQEYFDASGLTEPETTKIEGLSLSTLDEIHEDLKKAFQGGS